MSETPSKDLFEEAKERMARAWEAVRRFDIKATWRRLEATDWVGLGKRAVEWGKSHRETLLVVAIAVVAAVVGLGWYLRDRASKEDEARMYFGQGLQIYNRAVHDPRLSPQEHQEELGKALQMFETVRERFPSTAVAADALFYTGNALYEAGRYAEAAERFEEYVRRYPRRYLAAFAAGNIGACHEQAGDLGRAVEAYGEVRRRWPRSPAAGRAAVNIGRCHEAQGDFKSAFETYQSVQAEAPDSVWARQALLRAIYLEARFRKGAGR